MGIVGRYNVLTREYDGGSALTAEAVSSYISLVRDQILWPVHAVLGPLVVFIECPEWKKRVFNIHGTRFAVKIVLKGSGVPTNTWCT